MQPLELVGKTQWDDYWTQLRSSSRIHTRINVLDDAGDITGTLPAEETRGQVVVDRHGRRTSRMLTLDVDDPTGQLDFDPNTTPDDAVVFLTTQIQVQKAVWVPSAGRLVASTLFTGTPRRLWGDGRTIHITAHGLDWRARRPLGDTMTIERYTPKMDAIELILRRTGQTRFSLPEIDAVLERPLSLGPWSIPYDVCQLIAESENTQLYYTADAVATVRRWSKQPLYTFEEGREIFGRVRTSVATDDDFGNAVEVLGAVPSGGQDRIRVVVPVPDDHVLAIGADETDEEAYRAGLILRRHENEFITDEEMAWDIGERLIGDIVTGVVAPRFQSQPIWPIEEGDMVQMDAADLNVPFRADKFTLPVGTGARMLLGAHDSAPGQRDAW